MKKKILALGLVIAMVMPMTAMAAVQDVQPGQEARGSRTTQNGFAGQPVSTDVINYAVMVNLLTYDECVATTARLPRGQREVRQAEDAYIKSSLTGEYEDIFFNRENPTASWQFNSVVQDYSYAGVNNMWFTVDGQTVTDTGRDMICSYAGGTVDMGYYFSVTINGVTYDKCAVFNSGAAIRVPKAASSVILNFVPCDEQLSFDEKGWPVRTPVMRNDDLIRFHLKTGATPVDTASAQPQTTGASPMWKQNAKGWWLENADGTYLTNQWYLYNGQWYYMGADGYMLVNTTTPDGYWVNADGVWVQ